MPRKGIQLCYPFSEERLNNYIKECNYAIVQPKLNGVRAWWDGENLYSSEGNIINSVPHITDALLARQIKIQLDGELYIHGTSLQQIRSVVGRTKNLHPEYEQIQFHIFDRKESSIQYERLAKLTLMFISLLGPTDPLYNVPCNSVADIAEAQHLLANYIRDGYEGIVIRRPNAIYEEKRSIGIMKWKPELTDEYIIIDTIRGTGKYANTLGALIVMDTDGRSFHVGSFAIDDAERNRMWAYRDKLIGRKVVLRYSSLSDDGIPPSSVFTALVK